MHALLLSAAIASARASDAIRLVMRTQRVAGVSVALLHGGRIVYERGFGYDDLGRRTAATPHTVYRIGSLTKPFTAAAVVRLAAQGKLALSDPISHYVPVPWPQPISIEDLLAQRSGIQSYSDVDTLSRYDDYSPAQLLAAVASRPLAFDPGTSFAYSNTNYVLLGMAIERASGMPYGRVVDGLAQSLLNLQHTRYGDQPGEARGYARDTLNAPVRPNSVSYAYAAAGMTSNAIDLARFLQTVRAPYYGFLQTEIYGYPVEYAGGYVNGYSAIEVLYPAGGDEVIVLTNAAALDLMPLAMDLFSVLEQPKPGTHAPEGDPMRRTSARANRTHRSRAQDLRR